MQKKRVSRKIVYNQNLKELQKKQVRQKRPKYIRVLNKYPSGVHVDNSC